MFAWDDYSKYQISPAIHSDLRHEDIVTHLQAFRDQFPTQVTLKLLGESVESRSIWLLSLGAGSKRVFAWSQMHGNEPTHTAALLDLINFLLTDPEHPTAAAVLAECNLQLLLMLNPDGAERWTRRNAQDIDVNRDALHVQTPEGKVLRDAVLELQPNFALNLHNHRPRTTVGDSQLPASFSLLVPPIDAEETDTKEVLAAKRLAGYMTQVVESHSPSPISRYDADFMPRCFGEWVQQQGAATITIEAGGWTTVDAKPLVQLHFVGLIACLHAIATDEYREVSPQIYEQLPRTGEHDLFDKLLRGVTVVNGPGQGTLRADVGINFAETSPETIGGTITDLGDLHVTSGKQLTDAANLICLPGRIVWMPSVSPDLLPNAELVEQLLAQGVTTVLGMIDLKNTDANSLETVHDSYCSPINLGFLARVADSSPEVLERLVHGISHGILGVLADDLPPEVKLYLSLFNFPTVAQSDLPAFSEEPNSAADCALKTQQCAKLLGREDRGTIRLGAIADLLLYHNDSDSHDQSPLSNSDLHRVIVAGNVVFEEGKRTDIASGVLLRSSLP